MKMTNGTHKMFDQHSGDVMGFQNDKGQLYLYISKYERDYKNIYTY